MAHMSESGRAVAWIGTIASALAAVLISYGTISPTWWWSERGARVGLRAVELCSAGVAPDAPPSCVSRGLEGLGGGSTTWPKLGSIAFAIGWVAALFLAAAAAAALLAPRGRWTRRTGQAASAASLFALAVGAGFAWTYPGFEGLGAGAGLAAYLGGAAIGVGAGGLLIAGGASRRAP
jgi:hypothetical protein